MSGIYRKTQYSNILALLPNPLTRVELPNYPGREVYQWSRLNPANGTTDPAPTPPPTEEAARPVEAAPPSG